MLKSLSRRHGWKDKFYQQITSLSEEELRRAVQNLERTISRLQGEIYINQEIKRIFGRRLMEVQSEGRVA